MALFCLSVGQSFGSNTETEKREKKSFTIRAKTKSLRSTRSLGSSILIEGYLKGTQLMISFTTPIAEEQVQLNLSDQFGNIIYSDQANIINNQIQLDIYIDDEDDVDYYIEINTTRIYGNGWF